jgi:hypothetical protein
MSADEAERRLPELTVVGGCCGTDERHIGEMCRQCSPPATAFPKARTGSDLRSAARPAGDTSALKLCCG